MPLRRTPLLPSGWGISPGAAPASEPAVLRERRGRSTTPGACAFTRQVDAWVDADGGMVDPDGGLDDDYDDALATSNLYPLFALPKPLCLPYQ